jgi:uroporphyrinogen decarboxylase
MPYEDFQPDYRNILDAAYNRRPRRLPLYEHYIAATKMEEITGSPFAALLRGDRADRDEFFRRYCAFFRDQGYDTVSYEACVVDAVQKGECLSGHAPGLIKDRADFEAFDFAEVESRFWDLHLEDFRALAAAMPAGMKAVGGIGNGLFEVVQDFVGYTALCYLEADDPELRAELFASVGALLAGIWRRFLAEFADTYAVCRFGDDLGFKSSTLLRPDDIRALVVPRYRGIVELVHAAGKPFLLHSCGRIFEVMDDLIDGALIDAKHSNEDQIAPFPVWVERYGARIGLFGGVDMNALCIEGEAEIARYTRAIIEACSAQEGLAIGSGNSIPDYVPASGYLAMVNAVREARGD